MKKLTILIIIFFIISCGNQTAPPLNIQDIETPETSNEEANLNIPETQEATFSSEEEIAAEEPIDKEFENSGPSPEPVSAPPLINDIKEEVVVEPILFEDYAWERYMV